MEFSNGKLLAKSAGGTGNNLPLNCRLHKDQNNGRKKPPGCHVNPYSWLDIWETVNNTMKIVKEL